MLARDLSGNIATLTYDVVIALTPPLAPVITVPAADILTNTDFVTASGDKSVLVGCPLPAR